jgi:hypothetical protein
MNTPKIYGILQWRPGKPSFKLFQAIVPHPASLLPH